MAYENEKGSMPWEIVMIGHRGSGKTKTGSLIILVHECLTCAVSHHDAGTDHTRLAGV